ncbi:hypothetical protein Tsubulata_024693 [Turnera subulata]|uniref:Fatty acid desaturase domain-containing protein n=1 Tax=Turnera subulata TaxID=218843 RepID=A0A9Q0F3M1_9ROSI|nr:hypothetical protein Tsubulata_024693 [Turnera subulata]
MEGHRKRVPHTKPSFTIGDLKKAIPPHCFERSLPCSLNHRRHHSNTASLEHDELFVPKVKSKIPGLSKYLNNPPGRAFRLFITLTIGLPLYYIFNVSGREYGRFASHFDPNSPIYSDQERLQIYVSDVGVLTAIYFLAKLALANGLAWFVFVYGLPYIIHNTFVVTIVYLNHTHPDLPHYDSTEWDWLRGALSTVDRDYGFFFNTVFHNITDTHVIHHLFSTLPHYHAVEATKAIKPILGEYYQVDNTPVLKALWRSISECVYVDQEEGAPNQGVYWYQNRL